jgi:hypothetical protein
MPESHGMPSPSRTGTTWRLTASSSPAPCAARVTVGVASATVLSPAASWACAIALSTPSPTKTIRSLSAGQPAGGGRCVTMNAGTPIGGAPPQPSAWSK